MWNKIKIPLACTFIHFVFLNFIIQGNYKIKSFDFYLNLIFSTAMGIAFYFILNYQNNKKKR